MPPTDDDDDLSFETLTPPQRAFFKLLTDQRVANIVHAADLIGDMDAGATMFLRYINHEDGKSLREFLTRARPETLTFLTDLRKKEIEDIGNAIETAIALRRTFSFLRWGVAMFAAALITMMVLWEKFIAIFKSGVRP